MADKWQSEATKSLRSWGMNTFKPPDFSYTKYGQNRFQETPGRPDLMCWRGGRMTMVEIKDALTAFPFANFEQTKRDYAAKYCYSSPYNIDVWIWLCLGTGQPQWKPEKIPRLSWLIPLVEWYKVEEKVKPHQLSLPYRVGRGYNKIMQELKLDALNLLKNFTLEWKGSGIWTLSLKHPFSELYLSPQALPMYKQEDTPNVGINGHNDTTNIGNNDSSGRQRKDTGRNPKTNAAVRTSDIHARQYTWPLRAEYEDFPSRPHAHVDRLQQRIMDIRVGEWSPI